MPQAAKHYGTRFRKRGTAHQRGYGVEWQHYRAWYLPLHPLCTVCRVQATVVDHIVPVNQGGAFDDPANHQPLCRPCHQTKTAKERAMDRR